MHDDVAIQNWKSSKKQLPTDLTHTQKQQGGQIYAMDIDMVTAPQLDALESALNIRGLTVTHSVEEFGQNTQNKLYLGPNFKLYATRYTLENKLGAEKGMLIEKGRIFGMGKDTILTTHLPITPT